ncbi:MAG TPA: GDSL-type esterase/lipase family protein [Vicinamibacterales bacterium]|nr:GDSL-type esterase/lipase family protein [Vicinamibacterales bacterium]
MTYGKSSRARFVGWRGLVATAAAALVASCGSHHGPTSPDHDPLVILCPVGQAVDDLTNAPTMPVNFQAPATTGGQAPVTVVCNPASGTSFTLGQTPVSCTATDAAGTVASCGFAVTVTPVPMLSLTSFMAFGDSLTEGEVEPQQHGWRPFVTDPEHGYPAVLLQLLQQRYKAQTISLANEGRGGEHVADGYIRLQGVLDANTPQVLLLFEGINDLNDTRDHDEIPQIVDTLRDDIREAIAHGVETVFVSTLTPQREPTPGASNRQPVDDQLIRDANDEIRDMAAREGAIVVDGYAAIDVDVATLVGADGLHLTVAGYQALANAFFTVIQQNLELPAAPPSDTAPTMPAGRGGARVPGSPWP